MRRQIRDKSLTLLGSNIKKIRLEKKLSQEDIDEHVNFKHYNDIENGRINPTYLTLVEISKALHCQLQDLIPQK